MKALAKTVSTVAFVGALFSIQQVSVSKGGDALPESRRQVLEQKFGKFFATLEQFEVYGVKKKFDAGKKDLATVTGCSCVPRERSTSPLRLMRS